MHRRWGEREVAAVAARQCAVITHEQLGELGISRSSINRALDRGRLHRLHRGVYALIPPAALRPLAREHAAILACGGNTLISHASAAALYEMRRAPDRVDVVVIGHERGRAVEGIRIHRAPKLHANDVRHYRGIPVTAPARTLLDLAQSLQTHKLERCFDEAIIRRLVDRRAVLATLEGYPRHRGRAKLRELCTDTEITRSTGEKHLLQLVRRAGLPGPEVNARFGRFEVDFLWRDQRVAVELDGHEFHRSRRALERDHAKDMALQQAGFVVIRITGRQLARQPEMVLVWVATALARADRPAA
jgi:very-short-patch-repair endonuclease